MGRSVDERIVSMKFDNKEFEKNAKESIKTIDDLNTKTDSLGKNSKGFDLISQAAAKVDLSPIVRGIETVENKFSLMGTVADQVVRNLTTSAMNAIGGIMSKFSGMIKQGGMTRALNIEQAKFLLEGMKLDVDEVMKNALDAVNGTAYGLDEAAKVASTFGASGVKAGEDMAHALQGVAGAAAMTGRDFANVGDIFATVASNGFLMTEQVRQFSSSGLALMPLLEKKLGKSADQIQDMLQKRQIDFATFSELMYDEFAEHAKEANKTFNGAASNVKAAFSKIGANFFSSWINDARDVMNAFRGELNKIKAGMEETGGIVQVVNNFVHELSGSIVNFLHGEALSKKFTAVNEVITQFVGILHEVYVAATGVAGSIRQAFHILDNSKGVNMVADALRKVRDEFAFINKVLGFQEYKDTLQKYRDLKQEAEYIFDEDAKKAKLAEADKVFQDSLQTLSGLPDTMKEVHSAFSNLAMVLKRLKNMGAEVFETFGKSFSNAFDSMKKTTADKIVSIYEGFQNIANRLDQVQAKLFEFSKSNTFQSILSTVSTFGWQVGSIFGNLRESFSNVIGIAGRFATAVGTAFTNVFGSFGDILGSFDIGKKILDIFRAIRQGTDGFKEFTAVILNNEEGWAKLTDKLTSFFGVFRSVTSFLGAVMKGIGAVLTGFFNGLSGTFGVVDEVRKKLQDMGEDLSPLDKVFALIKNGLNSARDAIISIVPSLGEVGAKVGEFGHNLFSIFKEKVGSFSANSLVGALTSGVIASAFTKILTIVFRIKKIIEPMFKGNIVTAGVGALEKFGTAITDTFGAIQRTLDASVLLKIGAAVLMFAHAMSTIAEIDETALLRSMRAVTGIFAELLVGMKASSAIGKFKNNSLGVVMMEFAAAISILAGALKKISGIKEDDLANALASITALVGEMVVAMKVLAFGKEDVNGVKVAATTMISFAMGIKILAGALKTVSDIDEDSLANGLLSITILIGEMVVAMKLLQSRVGENGATSMIPAGVIAGILAMALALQMLVPVVSILGAMSIEHLAKGIVATALGMTILVGAMIIMKEAFTGVGGQDSFAIIGLAASMTAMAQALNFLIPPVLIFGNMPIDKLVQGLGSVAVMIGVVSAAIGYLGADAKSSIAGAASIALVVVALNLLIPPIIILGTLPLPVIAQGILAIGVALVGLIAIAGAASGVGAGLLILAGAVALIGAGTLMAGAGILFLSTALIALAGAGGMAIGMLTAIIEAIVVLLPNIASKLAEAVKNFIVVLINGTGEIVEALITQITVLAPRIIILITQIGTMIISALRILAPQTVALVGETLRAILAEMTAMVPLLVALATVTVNSIIIGLRVTIPNLQALVEEAIHAILETIKNTAIDIANTVFDTINGVLDVIDENLPEVVDKVTDILIDLINAIVENHTRIVDAGISAIVDFIEGMANAMDQHKAELGDAMRHLINSAIDILIEVLVGAIGGIFDVGKKLFGKDGLFGGLRSKFDQIFTAGKNAVAKVAEGIRSTIGTIFNVGVNVIKGFINGIKSMFSGKGGLNEVGAQMGNVAADATRKATQQRSPSKVFYKIGEYCAIGMANGIEDGTETVVYSATKMANAAIDATKEAFGGIGDVAHRSASELNDAFKGMGTAALEDLTDEIGYLGMALAAPMVDNFALKPITGEFDMWINTLDNLEGKVDSFAVSLSESGKIQRSVLDYAKYLYMQTDAYGDALERIDGYQKNHGEIQQRINKENEEYSRTMDEIAKKESEYVTSKNYLGDAYEDIYQDAGKVNEELGKLTSRHADLNTEYDKLQGEIDADTESIRQWEEALKSASGAEAEQLTNNINAAHAANNVRKARQAQIQGEWSDLNQREALFNKQLQQLDRSSRSLEQLKLDRKIGNEWLFEWTTHLNGLKENREKTAQELEKAEQDQKEYSDKLQRAAELRQKIAEKEEDVAKANANASAKAKKKSAEDDRNYLKNKEELAKLEAEIAEKNMVVREEELRAQIAVQKEQLKVQDAEINMQEERIDALEEEQENREADIEFYEDINQQKEEETQRHNEAMKDLEEEDLQNHQEYLEELKDMYKEIAETLAAERAQIASIFADAMKLSNQAVGAVMKFADLDLMKGFNPKGMTNLFAGYGAVARESFISGFDGEINEKWEKKESLADKFINHMKESFEKNNEFSDQIAKLVAAGFDKGFIAEITSLGPDSKELQALMSMSSSQLAEVKEFQDARLAEAQRESSKTMLQTMRDNYAAVAENEKMLNDLLSKTGDDTLYTGFTQYIQSLEAGSDEFMAFYHMTAEELKEASDIFQKSALDAEKEAAKTMLDNMAKQYEDAISFEDDLNYLLEHGLSEGLVEQLRNLGAGSEELKAFLAMDESMLNQATEYYNKTQEAQKTSAETVLESFRQTKERLVQWKDDIASLAGMNLSEGLIRELIEMGPDNREYLDAILTMNEEQIKELNDIYETTPDFADSLAGEVQNALMQVAGYDEEFFKVGQNLIQGVMDGVVDAEVPLLQMVDTTALDVLNGMKDAFQIHSPSEATYEMGDYLDQGLANGINDGIPMVVAAAVYLVTKVFEESYKESDRFYGVGSNMCYGMCRGLQAGSSTVSATAYRVAQEAYAAACAALGINSPSKMFEEIGRYSDEGFARGLAKNADIVDRASIGVGNSAIDKLRASISGINDIINGEIVDPVIRPVLDTSAIARSASELNGLFEESRVGVYSDGSSESNSGNTVVNYYQNNYSPKALRSVEIYRQTNNQLRNIKTALNRR